MKAGWQFRFSLATLLFLALSTPALSAQDAFQSDNSYQNVRAQNDTDPPGRVARIQYMSGEVSIQPEGVNDWVAANMNRPLTTADRVWTDRNSKAELSVGGGYIRLNSESSLTLSNVSDSAMQIELDQGTLSLTVRNLRAGEVYEVDTPNAAFTVMRPGLYRFDVLPNEDQTWATTRHGEMEATGGGDAVTIKSGEQVRFSDGNSLAHRAESAPGPDGFDEWAAARDQRLESSASARYVAPGVVGYEDLDAYGSWQTIAPYGPVWVPSYAPAGWAPYRFGHWAWIAPWGWTWVDDAPWGFAPFHYGRWVYYNGFWGWAPGPYRAWTPCYAPALVSWIGGPGWGFSFGSGLGVSLGWFPLGWGEPFYPWYHGWSGRALSPAYVRNVNVTNTYITNVTNVTNNYYSNNLTNVHYVNRNIVGAVTAAPQSALVSGQPINKVGTTVPPAQATKAPVVRAVNATPTAESRLGGQPVRTAQVPVRAVAPKAVVTRLAPPPRPAAEPRTNASEAMPNDAATHPAASAPTAASPNAGRNVPRPPSSSEAPVAHGSEPASPKNNNSEANAPHTVPRPPAASEAPMTGTAERSPSKTDNMEAATGPHVPRPPAATVNSGANAHTPATEPNHTVPRPPESQTQRTEPAVTPRVETAPAARSPESARQPTEPAVTPRVETAPAPRSPEEPPRQRTEPAVPPRVETAPAPRPSPPATVHEPAMPRESAPHPAPESKPKPEGPTAYVPRSPASYGGHPGGTPLVRPTDGRRHS